MAGVGSVSSKPPPKAAPAPAPANKAKGQTTSKAAPKHDDAHMPATGGASRTTASTKTKAAPAPNGKGHPAAAVRPQASPAAVPKHDDAHMPATSGASRTTASPTTKAAPAPNGKGHPAAAVRPQPSSAAAPKHDDAHMPAVTQSSRAAGAPAPKAAPAPAGGEAKANKSWWNRAAETVSAHTPEPAKAAVKFLVGAQQRIDEGKQKIGSKIDSGMRASEDHVEQRRDQLWNHGGVLGKVLSVKEGFDQGVRHEAYGTAKSLVKFADGASSVANPLEWAANPKANVERLQGAKDTATSVAKLTTPAGWIADPKGNSATVKALWDKGFEAAKNDPAKFAGGAAFTGVTAAVPGGAAAKVPKAADVTAKTLNGAAAIGKAEDAAAGKPPAERPSWRDSERYVGDALGAGYREQVSFKGGKEMPYGTKGSTRPDFYKPGESVEVKNYNVSTPAARDNLVHNVSAQAIKRSRELPPGTEQTLQIDVRGQPLSMDDAAALTKTIEAESNGTIKATDITIIR